MLVARHDDEREQPIRRVERLRDEEGHDRHLGDVELELPHHALERRRDAALVLGEFEAVGARAELPRHRIVADQSFQHAYLFTGGCARRMVGETTLSETWKSQTAAALLR